MGYWFVVEPPTVGGTLSRLYLRHLEWFWMRQSRRLSGLKTRNSMARHSREPVRDTRDEHTVKEFVGQEFLVQPIAPKSEQQT